MTSGLLLIACLVVSAGAPAAQSTEVSEAAGQEAAEAWLKVIDAGKLGTAWDQASTMFFEKKTKAARAPLGQVLSRKLASSQLAHALPGAPDGTYVIVLYDTRFERKEHARETVTVALDSGERFRGARYFIR